ncbi:MAG: ATP-binding cassette domain-containing protein [Alphaproteobacteria bacterium]|nr:ATP-binding cassette domain-containing protein [Alphaproteobacteria bacterium]
MAAPLLSLKDITLGFGGNPLFAGINLNIYEGNSICLVGRNGTGKTTLLKVITGLIPPDEGEIVTQTGCKTVYLPQEPDLSGYNTVTEYIAGAFDKEDNDKQYLVEMMLEEISLDGSLLTSQLSGGEARRATLVRAFIQEPEVLLLDEPTNHLDLPAIEWLEKKLKNFRGGLVLISHDRMFLNNLTRATLWLDRGIVHRNEKGFADFERWSEEILENEKLERHKLDRKIEREKHWLRYGVTARRKRNQGRLRRLGDLKTERSEQIAQTGSVKMRATNGKLSGKMVIEAENISKSYGDNEIIKDFSIRILRGDRIGIIGSNGAGKTTLLKMLTGDIETQSGHVRHGANLEIQYLDQKREKLNPELTIKETLCEAGGDNIEVQGQLRHVMGYMKDFLFKPEQAGTPVRNLSGGERNRLLLAKALARPSNLLIMDEPTNDLDIDTLDLLQEMISEYNGTVLLVSHDRDFLDRTVTSTIVLDGSGAATEYAGGYSDYIRQKQEIQKQAKISKKKSAKKSQEKKSQKKTKLSYKHQRALEELPKQIELLEKETAELENRLADSSFYTSNPQEFEKTSIKLEQIKNTINEKEEKWLEIEMMQEEFNKT